MAAELALEEVVKVLGEKAVEPATGADVTERVQFLSAGCVEFNASWISQVKEIDGVILAVASGRRDGRRIERVIDFLKKQEVTIKGAVLCDADEALIARYYKPGILERNKKVCEKKQAGEKA